MGAEGGMRWLLTVISPIKIKKAAISDKPIITITFLFFFCFIYFIITHPQAQKNLCSHGLNYHSFVGVRVGGARFKAGKIGVITFSRGEKLDVGKTYRFERRA